MARSVKSGCALGAIALAVVVGGFGLRLAVLYRNSRGLAQISETFPREYSVGDPHAPKLIYVALGDSIGQGTGVPRLAETLPYLIAAQLAESQGRRVQVINLAVSGARIQDVVRDQLPKLRGLKADVVTLNCGSNDATHFTELADFRRDMETALKALAVEARSPKSCLIATAPDLGPVSALMPILSTQSGKHAALQNEILKKLAAPLGFSIVDIYRDGKLRGSGYYASDDFHPSARGYAVWAELYQPFTILSKPTPPAKVQLSNERKHAGHRP